MTTSEALDLIQNPMIPCADRLRAAMEIGLEPRQTCIALEDARCTLESQDEPSFYGMLAEVGDDLLSIPF